MDSRGGNPFLIDDQSTVQDTGMFQQNSNPFLQEYTEPASQVSSVGENPFLNFTAEQTYQPSLDSTNPFASFVAEPSSELDLDNNIPTSDILSSHIDVTSTNIFQDEAKQTPDIFAAPLIEEAEKPVKTSSPSLPSRPPPPPRPPARTKDLILSVTGAMDATSSQMLDRLQQTRTPSPTLMHSPSPTPEHSVADLLDVDSSVPDISDDRKHVEDTKHHDILDLFDVTNSESIQPSVNPLLASDVLFTSGGVQENIFIPSEALIDDSHSTASSVEHIPAAEVTVTDTSLSGDSTNIFSGMNYQLTFI